MDRKSFLRHAKRGMEILKHQGPKAFVNKVKVKLAEKNVVYVPSDGEKKITYDEVEVLSLEEAKALRDGEKPVLAVQLHLFYQDLLQEFVEAFGHIPVSFDLYISIPDSISDAKERAEEIITSCKTIPNLNHVDVKEVPNRGRDIAPVYVHFGKELKTYKYVMHFHSKKSLYQGSEQFGWRQYSTSALIGDTAQALRMISLLEKNEKIGIIYPERYADMAPEAYGWLANKKRGKEFMESIGVPYKSGIFLYPAGSFFIVRNAAISQIWNRGLTLDDFDEEAGQTDGTLAHVLERVLGQVVTFNGFHHAIVAPDRKEIFLDKDKYTFAPVFLRNEEKLFLDLSAYDVVSFDIFDTLLTRTLLHPTDVFYAMELDLGEKGFAGDRIAAEQQAMAELGAKVTLKDIYTRLQTMLHMSDEKRDEVKQLELDTEFKGLIPRREMVHLYQRILEAKKRIILVSDMYLSREEMEPILEKFGITGYEKFYMSCEEDKRKDDGALWEQVLNDYAGCHIAHVGDNLRSDWQILSDKSEKTSWIMNPRQEEKIAAVPELEKAAYALPYEEKMLLHGLTVNAGLYNSPFRLYPSGTPEFKDAYSIGFSIFGPLMYEYMKWLHQNTPEDARLAFLAREGFIFQQVYEAMYPKNAKEHFYLLASRRSVSVAAIREKEDIYEICRRDYDGDLRNLLRSRLGAPEELCNRFPEKYVHFKEGMPDDEYDKVMESLEPYMDEILSYASAEREEYLSYFKTLVPEDKLDRTVFVDIGYTGTIQYYLCKLLNRPVTGGYMAVFKEHPKLKEKDAKVLSMYRKNSQSFAKVLEDTQLFLESVLQAPYGQLLRFKDGQPVYKEEALPPKEIEELQAGLLEYIRLRASYEDVAAPQSETSLSYMETLYEHFLSGAYLGEDVAGIFSVEDTYSQDTTLHYDGKTRSWKI